MMTNLETCVLCGKPIEWGAEWVFFAEKSKAHEYCYGKLQEYEADMEKEGEDVDKE